MYISGFLSSLCLKKINNWLGRKITYIVGAFIGICGCIWIKFGCDSDQEYTKDDVYIVAGLIGIGGSVMLVTSLALTAEFIGTDTDASAFIYGFMSLTDKVSNGLAVVLIQHFIPTKIDTCVLCKLYFRDVILYACGGAAILGILGIVSLSKTTVGRRRGSERSEAIVEEGPLSVNESVDERSPLI